MMQMTNVVFVLCPVVVVFTIVHTQTLVIIQPFGLRQRRIWNSHSSDVCTILNQVYTASTLIRNMDSVSAVSRTSGPW
jgi:hypothetical protein